MQHVAIIIRSFYTIKIMNALQQFAVFFSNYQTFQLHYFSCICSYIFIHVPYSINFDGKNINKFDKIIVCMFIKIFASIYFCLPVL